MARAKAEAIINPTSGDATFMKEIIMGYQGEMSLKGLNRNQFEAAMMKILRYRLKTVGKFKVYCTQSTFYMEPEEEDIDMDLAFERVSKVFGLAALSRAVVCEKDFDTICQTADFFVVTLVFCFEKKGVLRDENDDDSVIPQITPEEFKQYVADGVIHGGMIPKLENSFEALDAGVSEVVITLASAINGNGGTRIRK